MASNAALVGANTVKGPGPERASTRSASTKAPTKDDNSGTACAVSTMLIGAAAAKPKLGINTASTMCTTPLLHTTSALVTVTALFSPTILAIFPASSKSTPKLCPVKSGKMVSMLARSPAMTAAPLTTWYSNTMANCSLVKPATTEEMASNAALVGANTVKGPGPERASTRSASTK